MEITMIAARDEVGGLGKAGRMPWHCPADLRQFQAYTMEKPLLMGRKTAEPLRRRLSGRQLIIQSRTVKDPDFPVVRTVNEALAWMVEHPEYDELVIGGGGEIYALWLPYAAHLRISRIAGRFDCDTFFPKWDPQEWICRKQSEEDGFLLEEWDRTKRIITR